MRSLSLAMSECSLSGRGQGHVNNFYIVDLKKFRHSKSSVYRWYPQLVRGRFFNNIHRTMEATRSRHGWVHMFITHCPTVTLQLHNFDLFRTCRTFSFCTVAWQLARFQLTRRIARSLGDSGASCRPNSGISWTFACDSSNSFFSFLSSHFVYPSPFPSRFPFFFLERGLGEYGILSVTLPNVHQC